VSALPDGGMVADLDASGDVVLAVGGFAGVSAAKTGAMPMDSAKAVNARRRIMSGSFLCPSDGDNAIEFGLFPKRGMSDVIVPITACRAFVVHAATNGASRSTKTH
jgi:hypothetical protein